MNSCILLLLLKRNLELDHAVQTRTGSNFARVSINVHSEVYPNAQNTQWVNFVTVIET